MVLCDEKIRRNVTIKTKDFRKYSVSFMERRKTFDVSIWPTILLIVLLGFGFAISAWHIRLVAKQNSLETLAETSARFATEVERALENGRNQLEIIADILAEYDDISSEEAKQNLRGISEKREHTHFHVLTSENKIYAYKSGSYEEQESILNFEKEITKGSYISRVMASPNVDARYMYQAVPIQKNGEIKGILYGIVDLGTYPKDLSTRVFGGSAKLYLVDGANGEIIAGNWNDVTNVYADPNGKEYVKIGYDYNQWLENLKNGKADHIVAFSHDSKEYFYTYSQKVGINQWMVLFSAPESAVFARIMPIHSILEVLAVIDAIVLLAYFAWMIYKVSRENERNQRQVKNMEYMYEVQKALFDSYRCEESMTNALYKVGSMLTASVAFVCTLENMEITQIYQWPEETDLDEKEQERNIRKIFAITKKRLVNGENIRIDSREKKTEMDGWSFTAMKQLGISNVMLIPLLDKAGKMMGVLGTMNMKRHWDDTSWLGCTSWNFMMALQNLETYQMIEKMGTMDAVTGLKNRNCFEQSLTEYGEGAASTAENFCCIYMDVNGLHEINNTLGHTAGDEMLRYVGESIAYLFGNKDVYRIGGDEFVVFCQDTSKKDIIEKLSQLEDILERQKYCVSVGMSWKKSNTELEQLIREAERNMYVAKQQYYEAQGEPDKIRNRYKIDFFEKNTRIYAKNVVKM